MSSQCIVCYKVYSGDILNNKPVLIHAPDGDQYNTTHYMCFECYSQATYRYKCPVCNLHIMNRPQLYHNYPSLETRDAYKECSIYSNMYQSIINSDLPEVRSRLNPSLTRGRSYDSPMNYLNRMLHSPESLSPPVNTQELNTSDYFDQLPPNAPRLNSEQVSPSTPQQVPRRLVFDSVTDFPPPPRLTRARTFEPESVLPSNPSLSRKYMKYKTKYLSLKNKL
jgi:hypothetical protein